MARLGVFMTGFRFVGFLVGGVAFVAAACGNPEGETPVRDSADPRAPRSGHTWSIADAADVEGNSGTKLLEFTVTLSQPAGAGGASVSYATVGGAATGGVACTAGVDFVNATGTVTIPEGATSTTISVTICGDTDVEADEKFTVTLSLPSEGTIGDGDATGTIRNDDTTVSVDDVTVTEGNSGQTDATFTITLNAPNASGVTVQVDTSPGTATTADGDFVASSATVTFGPLETSKQVTVKVNGDTKDEDDETFSLNLSSPENAILADGTGVGTITNDDLPPTISIDDVHLDPEGSGGGTQTVSFRVFLSAPSGKTVSAQVVTADGTARAPSDYVAIPPTPPQTVTFAPGDTEEFVAVTVSSDNLDEPAIETFTLEISGTPVNATVADGVGEAMIHDDDSPPTLFIDDVTVVEGNTGTTTARFRVWLSGESGQTVEVYVETANGTALAADGDYTAITTPQKVTFLPGETEKFVDVDVLGDTRDEIDETFALVVASSPPPTNVTVTDGTGTATIADDDAPPTLSITGSPSVIEGGPGSNPTVSFTVSLSAPSGKIVTVDVDPVDGSATAAGGDYGNVTQTLTFNPGQTTQNVAFTVNGDSAEEDHETFAAALVNASNAVIDTAAATATATILNDDTTLQIADVSANEGDAGVTRFDFVLTLSKPTASSVTLTATTVGGTATSGSDFVAKTENVSFAPNDTIRTVSVDVNGDTDHELDETFFLNLSGVTGASAPDLQAIGTIRNDDAAPVVSIDDSQATVAEGNSGAKSAKFVVSLSKPSTLNIDVSWRTVDGTAQASDNDYVAVASDTVSIPAGSTSADLLVTIQGDGVYELDESFTVELTGATQGATISGTDGTGTGTIQNDDAAPTLAINDIAGDEGDTGTTPFTFTVSLSAAAGTTIQVSYATQDGTASSPSDYAATSGTLTFAPGETVKNLTVDVNGDTTPEADETFSVKLTSPTAGATLSDDTGTGTLTNDDGVPKVSVGDVTVTEGHSGTKLATFTVTLDTASALPVTVQASTEDGSTNPANAGSDYVALAGQTVAFAPGQTAAMLSVTILGDTVDEFDETFFVNLSNPTNAALLDGQGLGTITDDDVAEIRIGDATVLEGDSGGRTMTFTVTLDRMSPHTITADYASTGGTATSGSDFLAASNGLIFAPGDLSKTIEITVYGDTDLEGDESFSVTLSNATNAVIADGLGVGTIVDDDEPLVDAAPDAGDDAGADAGTDGGAPPVDAAGMPDATLEPMPDGGGCGCRVGGRTGNAGQGLAGLAALSAFGLLWVLRLGLGRAVLRRRGTSARTAR